MKKQWIRLLSWIAMKSGFLLISNQGFIKGVEQYIPLVEWVHMENETRIDKNCHTIRLTGEIDRWKLR